MVWPCEHGMVYGMVWRGLAWYMICLPGMAWHMVWPSEILHSIRYRLAGMTWYMVWPGEVWRGILYGLAGMAWYMIRRGEVWHGMWKCLYEFQVLWHCLGVWSCSRLEKPMSFGYPVHTYRSRSQVEGPLHACSVHMYSS